MFRLAALTVTLAAVVGPANAMPIIVSGTVPEHQEAQTASTCTASVDGSVECLIKLPLPQGSATPTRRILIRTQWDTEVCTTSSAQVVQMPGSRQRTDILPRVIRAESSGRCKG